MVSLKALPDQVGQLARGRMRNQFFDCEGRFVSLVKFMSKSIHAQRIGAKEDNIVVRSAMCQLYRGHNGMNDLIN